VAPNKQESSELSKERGMRTMIWVQVFIRESYQQLRRVEFVSDRISHITLRGHWFLIIVLNVHFPTEDKIDNLKDSFYMELESLFDIVPNYHIKMLLGDFNAKEGRDDFSN
jgi:hypothetical protein